MRDVIVIGGGPAGAVAALLLARAGVPVTVVEQARFPREKVCGECVSALGRAVLRRLGLERALLDAGAVLLRRAMLCAGDGTTADVTLPEAMLGASRGTMDALLLEAARRAGARVLQPARCERIEPGARPMAWVRDLEGNAVERLASGLVVLADGRSALMGRKPPAAGDLGVKAHFEGPAAHPPDAISLFAVAGSYGGVAPIGGGRFNVAFSVPAGRVAAARGDADALLAGFFRENRGLRRCLEAGRRASPWMMSPLPRFGVRGDWPEGVIPVGNAAAAIEPVGGEGMGLAMRSAELAAEAIVAADRAGTRVDTPLLLSACRALWRTRGPACRLAAVLLSMPAVCSAGMALVDDGSPAMRVAMALMGK